MNKQERMELYETIIRWTFRKNSYYNKRENEIVRATVATIMQAEDNKNKYSEFLAKFKKDMKDND